MAKQYPFRLADEYHSNVDKVVAEVVERVDNLGFTIWSCGPDQEHGIPMGWCTIGMTRVGLPEFYCSGMAPHSKEADDIQGRLRRLFEISKPLTTITNNAELCREVNAQFAANHVGCESSIPYQWRPIDKDRLIYGQGAMIRYWAKHEGIDEIVQGIQIVHRDAFGNFPVEDTPAQLLLEWTPFGTKANV